MMDSELYTRGVEHPGSGELAVADPSLKAANEILKANEVRLSPQILKDIVGAWGEPPVRLDTGRSA